MLACRNSNKTGNIATVKLLLKHKADVNHITHTGWTPLMAACRYSNTESNIEIVKLLLDYKADVNLLNRHQHDPLSYACKFCTSDGNDIINILLDCPTIIIKKSNLKVLLGAIYGSKHIQLDTLGKLLSKIVY